MEDKVLIYVLCFLLSVGGLLLNWRVNHGIERIKALEKQLEKKVETPKPDYDKYKDCCAYYPD